ncbi:MAG: hypothetical protein Q7S27_00715 [Nanoarchaeota archaeon]|nr:hypothetical protein [Nanoarchaeota archaeon]
MNKQITSKEKNDLIREHFYYEVFMLINLRNYLIDYFSGRNSLFTIHQNVLINSILLHSRNLLEFFYYPIDKNNNYARARDFMIDWEKKIPNKTKAIIELEKRTSNECTHLTYNRLVGLEHKKWDLISMTNDLIKLIKLFLDNLPQTYFDEKLISLHNNLKAIDTKNGK